MKNLNPIN